MWRNNKLFRAIYWIWTYLDFFIRMLLFHEGSHFIAALPRGIYYAIFKGTNDKFPIMHIDQWPEITFYADGGIRYKYAAGITCGEYNIPFSWYARFFIVLAPLYSCVFLLFYWWELLLLLFIIGRKSIFPSKSDWEQFYGKVY